MNRKIARVCLLSILAAAGLAVSAPGEVFAQAGYVPKKKESSKPPRRAGDSMLDPSVVEPLTESVVDKLFDQTQSREWLLKVEVRVDAFESTDSNGMPVPNELAFQTAAVVFPVPKATAGHRLSIINQDDFVGDLSFNDKKVDVKPSYIDNYACGTRLAKWEMRNQTGRTALLQLTIPQTCFGVSFNEQLSYSIPWPKGAWTAVAQSTFQPQMGVDYIYGAPQDKQVAETAKAIDALIKEWTGGKDLKSVPPVLLAKVLAGEVLGYVQVSGDGVLFNKNSSFQGFNLKGALAVAHEKRGSEHDIACFLAAVYRRAGIPARTVVGLDIGNDNKNVRGSPLNKLRSWVEFCILDPVANVEIWVPVDIVRQRKSSSRPPDLNVKWDYFGNNADLDYVLPLAFQYHPPTTVQAHGSPCLWGWMTTPVSQSAQQSVRFMSQQTPKRADRKPEEPGNDPKK